MKRFWSIILWISLALPMMAQEETLCMDGTLLFREDFGGNDPSDPVAGTDPVPGMTSSYMQIYDTAHCNGRSGCTGMSSGRYLVTKVGYRNSIGYSYSHWFIMDDHTYPDDYSRGYLLEIDGRTDGATIYETIIDGLCEGSRLTFTAYAVNVTTAHSYDVDRNNGDPQLSFVLADPETGSEITTPYKTGPIPVDRSYKGMPGEWRNSAHWNLVGMNFTVPPGRTAIKLIIKNACMQYNGNDFAIDDIEIRLCAPPVTIEGEAEVCTNASTTLTANFTNDGTFAEPLAYKWWHSADSVTWTEIADFNGGILSFDAIQKTDSGWYKVAVSGDGNIESVNCRAMSEPFRLRVNECAENLCIDGTLLFREDFGGNDPSDPAVSSLNVPGMSSQYRNAGPSGPGAGRYTVRKEGWPNGIQWHRQDDHTYPDDKTRGYLLEVDGIGGAEPFYSTTIDGLCAGSKLTFSAYVVNAHYAGQLDYFGGSYVYPRMKFILKDPTTDTILAEKSTGDIQPDWRYGTPETWKYARENYLSAEWQLIGVNFVVPDGIESIQMFIYNDVAHNGTGNDFALDDIEIHLCVPPVTIEGEAEVCVNTSTTLTANFTNDGTFDEPLAYKWWHSLDSVTWSEMSGFNEEILPFDAVQKTDSGWYKVAVSGAENIESENCRAMSEPFRLKVSTCEPPVPPCPDLVTITTDTTVCDTLMPYRWRDTLFTEPTTYSILYKNARGCDSLIRVLTLGTQVCCPNVVTITADTTVCDTLMPFTWTIGGQTFVFEQAQTQEREMPHPKWTECTGTVYTLRLDTFHCEKLWPVIVNKYNWQLLLDNVTLARFFPHHFARTYQWYKNEAPIPGANDDDYSEYNELCGRFQLRIEMDNGQTIWSNILEIGETQAEEPVRVRIYDSHGVSVQENQLSHGVYLYRYEQGDRKWTEKRLIP